MPVTRVEEVTGFPECLDGRVKTLHPRVHAGLLADTRLPTHAEALESLDIAPFDLLVVNLYPFTATVASGASPDDCVEQIDIGGPAMIRAAAKNHESVAVVTDPTRYAWVLEQAAEGGVPLADRRALAAEAFRHTASYDVAVASWMGNVLAPDGDGSPFPGWVGTTARRRAVLRYGENPHQAAALYGDPENTSGIAGATQLHGKEMSYNNYVDTDAAWRAAHDHDGVVRGDHQAREPVRDRGRHRRRRGAPAGPRLRPDQRVRRGHRRQHRGLDGHGRDGLGHLHRGDRRPVLRRRRGGDPGPEEEHPGAHRHLGALARRAAGDLRRAAAPAARRRRRPRRRPRALDPGLRRGGVAASSSPTSPSPGAPAAR